MFLVVLLGVLQQDLTVSQASQTYTLLTVGDGLVSQIPALIVSTAAGLLVTKVAPLVRQIKPFLVN